MAGFRDILRVTGVVWLLTLAVVPVPAAAAGAPGQFPASGQALKNLSLEALGELEVTSMSKDGEAVRRTPAAVHIITSEDIRRSGATSLPDLLRQAPGVSVGRIDSTHWSVGVRGFGDQFSKSVLVLMDGRSIYTPLFGGVFWALQDTALAEIDHIEVIRGPGGTIWGSNAVNGIINIVTKTAAESRGLLASFSTGNVDRAIGTVRFGGGNGRGFDYRVYGKAFNRGPSLHTDGQDFDTWKMRQVGGRADWRTGRDTISIFGDVYGGDIGQSVSLGTYNPPAQALNYDPIDATGGNVMAKWRRTLGDASHIQAQVYFDRTRILGPQIGETRNTFDADVTHQMALGSRQRLLWGAGVRVSPSVITQPIETLDVTPHDHTQKTYSLFVQDEIEVVPDKLTIMAGAKLEHYTYTGLETQPSLRAIWMPTERHSVWAAVTRAVRTPSRLERGFSYTGFAVSTPLPTFIRVVGNPNFDSERLLGYEAGYRATLTSMVYVDAAVFHNRHDDLGSFGAGSVITEATPAPFHAVLLIPYANGVRGTSDGFELAPRWRPAPWWDVRTSYAYFRPRLTNVPGNTDTSAVGSYEGSTPRHQALLQSMINLPGGWELEQVVRYASALPARDVKAFTTADLRVGWRSVRGVQIGLTGQNLVAASHVEFGHDPGPAVAVRRSVLLTATWTK